MVLNLLIYTMCLINLKLHINKCGVLHTDLLHAYCKLLITVVLCPQVQGSKCLLIALKKLHQDLMIVLFQIILIEYNLSTFHLFGFL